MAIPSFYEPRGMLEHCLEFSDKMDCASARNGLDSLKERAAELREILPYDEPDRAFEIELLLTETAIYLLEDICASKMH